MSSKAKPRLSKGHEAAPLNKSAPKSSSATHKEKEKESPKVSRSKGPEKNTSTAEKLATNLINEALKVRDLNLDITSLELVALPAKLYKDDSQWDSIDMGFNKFTEFPDFPPLATSLTMLVLDGNKITSFPPELSNLCNLLTLTINGNQLSFIPSSITGLSSVTRLEFSNNQIASISPEFGNLKQLEVLKLNGNPLQTIPAEIGNLIFLETLDLNSCSLMKIPDEFTGCRRILELDLGHNLLTSLPDSMGNISRLVTLNLSDNKIREIPVSLGACNSLNSVQIERNPIEDTALLQKYKLGTDHFRDYLEKKWFAITQEKKRTDRASEKKTAALSKSQPRNSSYTSPQHQEQQEQQQRQQQEQQQRQQQRQAEKQDLRDREVKYRQSSQKLTNDMRNELLKIKKFLNSSNDVQSIVVIAKAIREIIPHIDNAHKLLPNLPPLQTVKLLGTEDAATKIKKSTIPRIQELENIIDSIIVNSNTANLELLLEFSGVITPILNALQGISEALRLQ